jgi:hypothetical protein
VDVLEERLEVRREVAEVPQRRRQVARRLSEVAHERVGVLGEASSRLTVARVSRRKVGKIWNVSASASSRDASAPKVASPSVIRPAQLAVLARDRVKTRPGVAEHPPQRTSCSASGRSRSAPPVKNGRRCRASR